MTTCMSLALAPVLDAGAGGCSMGGLAALAVQPMTRRPPQAHPPVLGGPQNLSSITSPSSSLIPVAGCNGSLPVTSPPGRYPLGETKIPTLILYFSQASSGHTPGLGGCVCVHLVPPTHPTHRLGRSAKPEGTQLTYRRRHGCSAPTGKRAPGSRWGAGWEDQVRGERSGAKRIRTPSHLSFGASRLERGEPTDPQLGLKGQRGRPGADLGGLTFPRRGARTAGGEPAVHSAEWRPRGQVREDTPASRTPLRRWAGFRPPQQRLR